MKTITTLIAALATATALFASPAVQAADNDGSVNPHTTVPYLGWDAPKLAALAAAATLFASPAVQAADNDKRVNPHATVPYLGWDAPKR